MAVTRLTPMVGTTGTFSVAQPFVVGANTLYSVTAVRRFTEIIGRGTDLFTELYEPLGIAKATFDEHLAANACVIVLQPEYDAPVLVPDTYITSYPKNDSLRYRRIIMGVDLGPLPPGLDVTYLKTILAGNASDIIGVDAEVKIMEIPLDDTVTQEQHEINEARRLSDIKSRDTVYARVEQLTAQVTSLLETQARLVELLEQNNIPVNPTP